MGYNPNKQGRRSIRLKGYDYSQPGAYFVTIVTRDRTCLFGEIANGGMRLNGAGRIIQDEWTKSAVMRPRVTLDEFVVMPNHIHGIIALTDDRRDTSPGRGTLLRAPTPRPSATERFGKPTSDSIPTIIRLFKSATTKRINVMRDSLGFPVWQRNYYEHIIRNDESLYRIREYIANNPSRWALDHDYPAAAVAEPEDAWLA